MSMHWVKADGASQTWHDEPAAPIEVSAPSESTWRVCDLIAAVVLVGTIAAYFAGVFS